MATSNNVISLRRHDLDNLRVFLTDLVIAHHTAIAYGGPGRWFFKSACVPTSPPSPLLGIFNAFNQSFFMDLFFGISGHVSVQSLSRLDRTPGRSRWEFVKSKLLRLAAPAIFYTLAVQPLVLAVALPKWDSASLRECWTRYFRDLQEIRGPVWYMSVLALFDIAAAVVKPKAGQTRDGSATKGRLTTFNYRTVGRRGWIAVACASFFIRLYYPVGKTMKITGLQPAYFAQYVFAYTLSHLSFDQDESRPAQASSSEKSREFEDSSQLTELSLSSAVTLSLLTMPLCFASSIYAWRAASSSWAAEGLWGGWSLSALGYAIWNELSFIMVGPALLRYFAKRHNAASMSTLQPPRYSYAAFLSHGLVSAVAGVGIDWLILSACGSRTLWMESSIWKAAGPVVMTGIASTVNIWASWKVGRLLVDHVPGLNQII